MTSHHGEATDHSNIIAGAFCGVGAAKGLILGRSALRAGLETLLTGAAAAMAFVVGTLLRQAFRAA